MEMGMKADAKGKYFRMRSYLNDMCVDLFSSPISRGLPVVMRPQTEELIISQQWWEDKINHCIRSRLDEDFVLTMKKEIDSMWLVVDKWDPNSKDEQKFVISGKFVHRLCCENEVMDIAFGSQKIGAKLCIYAKRGEGGANQCWHFDHVDPQYFYLRSGMNNKVLSLENGRVTTGTNVVTYEKWASEKKYKQLWWEDEDCYIRAKANGFALDYNGPGSNVICNLFEDKKSQHWRYDCVGHSIKDAEKPDQCVAIRDSIDAEGASVAVEYPFNKQSNQYWYMAYE